ncbi:DUF1189 domain-containing protein [Halalkalibacter alkaliphilus]|uniref:DUF1189 domain-containing protein n=1 Tax=Halalkalibacter alkaliphilus TaxID=2917993 RepID=A0A9X2I404_9BACI|nr:DUF1189 domain-containing protein [Halalkalibacter alkaliphilus]MCL7747203.1 DUF1189 domain-containing protein [Halalkalibacter alkaliphilus]
MSYWEWFFKSFYNRKVIAYSRFRPITTTIGFVLMIIFIASIPYFISLNITIVSSVQQLDRILENDLPDFHLVEGTLVMEKEEVYITDEVSEGFFLIDPANSLTEGKLLELEEGIALQEKEFLFISNGQIQSISYSLLGLQELSKEDLSHRISQLLNFLPILLTIITSLLFVGLAGLGFLSITILAFLALFIKGKRKLEYRHMWIITAHALTLPVILLYWIDILIFPIPFTAFALSTFLIVLAAIRSIPIPKRHKHSTPS